VVPITRSATHRAHRLLNRVCSHRFDNEVDPASSGSVAHRFPPLRIFGVVDDDVRSEFLQTRGLVAIRCRHDHSRTERLAQPAPRERARSGAGLTWAQ
jgi:hypothetical protein